MGNSWTTVCVRTDGSTFTPVNGQDPAPVLVVVPGSGPGSDPPPISIPAPAPVPVIQPAPATAPAATIFGLSPIMLLLIAGGAFLLLGGKGK